MKVRELTNREHHYDPNLLYSPPLPFRMNWMKLKDSLRNTIPKVRNLCLKAPLLTKIATRMGSVLAAAMDWFTLPSVFTSTTTAPHLYKASATEEYSKCGKFNPRGRGAD